jgi:hypothetical protein
MQRGHLWLMVMLSFGVVFALLNLSAMWLLPPRLVGFLNTDLDAAFGKHGFATA